MARVRRNRELDQSWVDNIRISDLLQVSELCFQQIPDDKPLYLLLFGTYN